MPVVPFTSQRERQPQSPLALRDPPSPAFALMAAAQVHAEGRLVQKDMTEDEMTEWNRSAKPGADLWYDPKKHGSLENAIEQNPEGLMLEKENIPDKAPPGTEILNMPWVERSDGPRDGRKFIRKISPSVPIS